MDQSAGPSCILEPAFFSSTLPAPPPARQRKKQENFLIQRCGLGCSLLDLLSQAPTRRSYLLITNSEGETLAPPCLLSLIKNAIAKNKKVPVKNKWFPTNSNIWFNNLINTYDEEIYKYTQIR